MNLTYLCFLRIIPGFGPGGDFAALLMLGSRSSAPVIRNCIYCINIYIVFNTYIFHTKQKYIKITYKNNKIKNDKNTQHSTTLHSTAQALEKNL